MNSPMLSDVADLIRLISQDELLPRYRNLQANEIKEKAPGDLVTAADEAVEAALAKGLGQLLPEAHFIGEERCARSPELLDTLDQGLVWVVDPIDGTGNFAMGKPPFAIMVALLRDGEAVASWLHDPLSGRMMVAERGGGAWSDGAPIRTTDVVGGVEALTGIVSSFSMPDNMRDRVDTLKRAVAKIRPTQRCAGHEYPLVALSQCDFVLYWRTLVWDHVAGALLLTEAGGAVERLDGTAYRPGSNETGLLLARNRQVADHVRALLRDSAA